MNSIKRIECRILASSLVLVLAMALLFPVAAFAFSPNFPPRPDPGVPPPRPTPPVPDRPGLPPRPDDPPQPDPTPVTPPPLPAAPDRGGLIELWVRFDPAWPWDEYPWQGMETLVQWQDGLGEWHNVDSWRGGFDECKGNDARKSWWVSEDHFGSGPFRWVLYLRRGDETLVVSESFDMPSVHGEIVRVSITLAP